MNSSSFTPFVIWIFLIGLTVASTFAAERHVAPAYLPLIIFAGAGIKAYLIVMDYMEARHAASHWRRLYLLWICGTAALLIGSQLALGWSV